MSVDLRICAVVALVGMAIAAYEDPRWWRWIRRRMNRKHVLPAPNESCRRDVNAGWWS